MTLDPSKSTFAGVQDAWLAIRQALGRPYRVTASMVLLIALVPFYLVVAGRAERGVLYTPEVPWDRLLPLAPAWALVYGALYLFLIVVPVIVIQDDDLIAPTVLAYLTVWIASYVCFLLYPTYAPRPERVIGGGFAVWGLRFLYDADPPYNCFPSLHVAHSFVSALACYRVHRLLGLVTLLCASLVAISTLFTKQHYVADVVVGMALAWLATTVWFRHYTRTRTPAPHRQVAPILAAALAGLVGIGVAGLWAAYHFGALAAWGLDPTPGAA